MGDHMLIAMKVGFEVTAATSSTLIGIVAVDESAPLMYGAFVAVFGFAGLLVRELVKAQRAIWQIVEAKDRQIADRDDVIHYLRWEHEKYRFEQGDRTMDPGDYHPRRLITGGAP